MDTTFWGPSGHQLLHLITYRFDRGDLPGGEKTLRSFFRSVGHVLPCIYCRRSFQKYAKEQPLRRVFRASRRASRGASQGASQGAFGTFRWYYRIHNRINAKLRGQGYPVPPNPSFHSVLHRYQKKTKTCLVGRDFLYAVAYQFSSSLSERRKQAYRTFFQTLALLYPVDSIRDEYARYLERHPVEHAMKGKIELTRWFHRFDQRIDARVCTFRRRCNVLEKYHVQTCANRTCRR